MMDEEQQFRELWTKEDKSPTAVPAGMTPPAVDGGQQPQPAEPAQGTGDPAAMPGSGDVSAKTESEPAAATDDKELQRQKSWEGRLKAREAELKAREAELKAREEQMAAGAKADQKPAEVKPEVGAGDVEAIIVRMTEDFGPEFVGDIKALIQHFAGVEVGGRIMSIEQKIAGIGDEFTRLHFEDIQAAHPDFDVIGKSPEFAAWVDSLGQEKADAAKNVIAQGSSKQVISLLADYKAATQKQKKEDPLDDMSALADVSTGRGGMRLPERPTSSVTSRGGSDDEAAYAALFNQVNKSSRSS